MWLVAFPLLLANSARAQGPLEELLQAEPPDPFAAALEVARAYGGEFQRDSLEQALDRAVKSLRAQLAQAGTAEARIDALQRTVHRELALEVEDDATRELDPISLFPHQVLDRRRGACLGLSLIYIYLAQQVGLDVRGVSLPGHFFVRYYEGDLSWNLETTLGGLIRSDAWYREHKGLPPPPARQGNYLRDLTSREVIGEILNNVGGAYLRSGRLGLAEKVLRQACDLTPDDPDAFYNLALIQRRAERANASLQAVNRSLQLFPRGKEALNLRGLLLLDQERPDLALGDFSLALEVDGGEARYWNNRATAHCRMGNLSAGVEDFDQAIELSPDWSDARRNRALALLELGRTEQALVDLERAQIADWRALFHSLPPAESIPSTLGQLAGRLEGKRREAAREAHLEAAERLLAENQPREAKAAANKALQLGGHQVEAYCLRGSACEELGDELWAKRNYYLAMEADPRDPLGFRYMAFYYLDRNRHAVAADYLQQYLDRAPDVPDRAEVEKLLKGIQKALGR